MFDQLFDRPSAVARYHNGPMFEERHAFLTHLAKQGLTFDPTGASELSFRIWKKLAAAGSPPEISVWRRSTR